MMKAITTMLGALLTLIGVAGMFNHGAMGMNLNPLHIVLLLGSGITALYFGIRGTEFEARKVCRVLGVVLALVGVIGLFMGPGIVTLNDLAGRASTHLLKLLPGHLELGTADSITNVILGLVGLIAGFFPREKEIEIDMASAKAKEKVTSGR